MKKFTKAYYIGYTTTTCPRPDPIFFDIDSELDYISPNLSNFDKIGMVEVFLTRNEALKYIKTYIKPLDGHKYSSAIEFFKPIKFDIKGE